MTDKTVTFTMPDMKRGIRGNKLGDGYGKAELIERIDVAVKEKAAIEAKRIAEENARAEAVRIAKAEAEAREKVRIEAKRKAAAEKAEQRRKEELSQKKRKLAFERNNIQFEYFMANADSDDWNSDYSNYLISEKITDYDSKTLEELSVPILTKEEFEQKQIEKMQEAISEKAREVKEPILFFWEFNEMMERESAMHVKSVESVQNVVVEEKTEEPIAVQPKSTEELKIQDISRPEPIVEEVADVESVIERPLTIEERAREISLMICNDYGRYDNVPAKVKAELFQFSIDDLQADMKLHSLVLKELNVKMYSSELYDDYMSVVDVTDKKKSGEEQSINYYNSEKRWNRSR